MTQRTVEPMLGSDALILALLHPQYEYQPARSLVELEPLY
jgi:hypothetical protein